MEDFEVGNFGLVARFHKNFEPCLDESGSASAEDGLLAKKIGLGFFFEGGLEEASAGGADPSGPGHGNRAGLAGGVLLHREEGRNATSLDILAANDMSWAFGGDKDDVDIFGWLNGLIVNGEAVAEEEALTFAKIGGDVLLVDGGNFQVGYSNENDIGAANGFSSGQDFKAVFFGDGDRFAAFVETDGDFDAAIFEVKGVGVALGAEANDGGFSAKKGGKAGVTVVVDSGGHMVISCSGWWFSMG